MQNLYHTYSFYYNKPKLKNYEKNSFDNWEIFYHTA